MRSKVKPMVMGEIIALNSMLLFELHNLKDTCILQCITV